MPNLINPNAARDAMLKRVASDFTYKKEMTDEQLALFRVVKTRFDTFRKVMAELFRYLRMEIAKEHIVIDAVVQFFNQSHNEYELILRTMRSAERWFNTAIANDWETGKVDAPTYRSEDEELLDLLEYSGPPGGDTTVHHTCDAISKECYELTMYLVSCCPQGRAISVAVTKMQDVRGELLDVANAAMPFFPPSYNETGDQGEADNGSEK